MDPFFTWVEDGALSTWLRESPSLFGFPGVLALHIAGTALAAGSSLAIALALLGFVPDSSAAAMARFLKVFWIGLTVSTVAGVLLVVAYPTKELTNPMFYVKMGIIVAALFVLRAIWRRALTDGGETAPSPSPRGLAITSIGLWAAAITAGRLLAYTYTRLLVSF